MMHIPSVLFHLHLKLLLVILIDQGAKQQIYVQLCMFKGKNAASDQWNQSIYHIVLLDEMKREVAENLFA